MDSPDQMSRAVDAYMDSFSSLDSFDQFRSPSLTDSLSSKSSECTNTPATLELSSSSQLSDQAFLHQLQTDVLGSIPSWAHPEDADYFGQYDNIMWNDDPNDKSLKQMKRKAQNRAAQRAFRERKERSIRELEESVTSLRVKAADLESENKRLSTLLQEARIEIKTLKSFSALSAAAQPSGVVTSINRSRTGNEAPNEIILRIDLGELTGMRAVQYTDASSLQVDRQDDVGR